MLLVSFLEEGQDKNVVAIQNQFFQSPVGKAGAESSPLALSAFLNSELALFEPDLDVSHCLAAAPSTNKHFKMLQQSNCLVPVVLSMDPDMIIEAIARLCQHYTLAHQVIVRRNHTAVTFLCNIVLRLQVLQIKGQHAATFYVLSFC